MSNPARSKLFRFVVAGAVAVSAAVSFSGQAGAAPADVPTAGKGVSASYEESQKILDYWTEERMRAAIDIQAPVRPEGVKADPVVNKLPGISAAGAVPKDAITNSTQDIGVLANSVAQRWHRQGQMPAVTLGKLYSSGGRCSGAIISAGNRNTVWAAGHCIHPGGGGAGRYFNSFMFAPDADNNREPHGRWAFKFANTTIGWQDNRNFDFDIAALAFWPQSQRGNLQDRFGSQGYKFGHGRDFGNVHSFGFPADGYRRTDFDQNLWFCQGGARDAGWFDDRMVMNCDMGRGASGGPFLEDLQLSRGWGYIVGSNSHRDGDANGNFTSINLYSSYHGDGAINIYNNVSNR